MSVGSSCSEMCDFSPNVHDPNIHDVKCVKVKPEECFQLEKLEPPSESSRV